MRTAPHARGAVRLWAGHAVDIGGTFDRAVASLRAHAAYLAVLGGPSPEAFLRAAAEQSGEHLPCATLAAAFELIKI